MSASITLPPTLRVFSASEACAVGWRAGSLKKNASAIDVAPHLDDSGFLCDQASTCDSVSADETSDYSLRDRASCFDASRMRPIAANNPTANCHIPDRSIHDESRPVHVGRHQQLPEVAAQVALQRAAAP
jgi:hypothetical protein